MRRPCEAMADLRGAEAKLAKTPTWMMDAELAVRVMQLQRDGFVVLPKSVPDQLCEELEAQCISQAGDFEGDFEGNRGPSRCSVNASTNVQAPAWWDVLVWLTEDPTMVSILSAIAGGSDAWWFDVCGGDVVGPRAPFAPACYPHTDWAGGCSGSVGACYSVSIFVHAIDNTMAPMKLVSESSGQEFIATGVKGQLLIRDVNTIHYASPNDSDKVRVFPAFRFITKVALRLSYQPTPFVPEHVWQKFPQSLKKRAVFLRLVA